MTNWVIVRNTSKRTGVYHTDRECTYLQQADAIRKVEPNEIEAKGLKLCSRCEGSEHETRPSESDWSAYNALKRASQGD